MVVDLFALQVLTLRKVFVGSSWAKFRSDTFSSLRSLQTPGCPLLHWQKRKTKDWRSNWNCADFSKIFQMLNFPPLNKARRNFWKNKPWLKKTRGIPSQHFLGATGGKTLALLRTLVKTIFPVSKNQDAQTFVKLFVFYSRIPLFLYEWIFRGFLCDDYETRAIFSWSHVCKISKMRFGVFLQTTNAGQPTAKLKNENVRGSHR